MTQTKTKSALASDTWLTPLDFYDKLHSRFAFGDFDPCPAGGISGLEQPWADRAFCNPPYSRKLKEAFIHKAYAESSIGKLVVMLLPASTSSAIFHKVIKPHARVEFIEGRLYFEGIDGSGDWINPGKGWKSDTLVVPENARWVNRAGQNDSMLVIFDVTGSCKKWIKPSQAYYPYAANLS